MPLVSIIIPCYNAARYVAAAIQSAMDQTWPEKEIIVVNDGSTDGSREVLEGFRTRGIRIIHQENRGQCAAANRGFAESRGEYVKFFDADDLISPRMIELQMARLAGSTTAVASAEWGRFYGDDLSTFKLNPEPVWKDMDARDWVVESWLTGGGMMQCALFLIPRPLLERSGLWDERLFLYNDTEFFTRVLCHATEVRFTPGARLYYRSGIPGSVSGRRTRQALESMFHGLMLARGHLLARRQDPRARAACATILQKFIYDYYPEEAPFRDRVAAEVKKLGGSRLAPDGPPGFQLLRHLIGWKLARRLERLAIRHGLNRAGLRQRFRRRGR